jgi:hypothetical protein
MSDSEDEFERRGNSSHHSSPYSSSFLSGLTNYDNNINLFDVNRRNRDNNSSMSSLDLEGFQENK